jgi:enterochelin esterase-like enzyme
MYKGQAPPQVLIHYFGMLILSFFWMLWMVGCSTETPPLTPEQPIPTISPEPIQPSQTSTAVAGPTDSQTIASPTPNCLSTGGILTKENFYSTLLEDDFSYKIYLPPCYEAESEQQYPVLYLLHGFSYDNEQWVRLGLADTMDTLVQSETIAPFIVVLPTESPFDPPELSLYGDILVSELIPDVEVKFRTINEKPYRGIGGLSRGAAWSIRLGFEHYELFDKVGAHSLPLFQGDGSRLQTWLTQIPKEDLPLFLIDIGRDDPEWQSAKSFADQLDQNGVPHEWYLFTGEHSESYWSDHLVQYLLWYGKDW